MLREGPRTGWGHAEIDRCIIAYSQEAPFKIDSKSSILFTNTLCDQQLLPGAENRQGAPEFEDIQRNRFNCSGIVWADGTTASCRLSGTLIGASINPVDE